MHAQQLRKHLLPSIEWLRENLRYDPETGELWWIKPGKGRTLSKPAGSFTSSHGRRTIGASEGGCSLLASRVAFVLMEGRWPDSVDHINGNKTDDRWENLRETTHQENLRNQKKRCTNTSGIAGVTWVKKVKKWKAQIMVDGRCIYLGHYDTIEEAADARKAAEVQYGFHENHGRDTTIATTEPTQ